jgi:hypothetical protein
LKVLEKMQAIAIKWSQATHSVSAAASMDTSVPERFKSSADTHRNSMAGVL